MYNEKVREYYRNFYGKTYANMASISEYVNFSKVKGVKNPGKYDKAQIFHVYKL